MNLPISTSAATLNESALAALSACGVELSSEGTHEVRTPITGDVIATVARASSEQVLEAISTAHEAFLTWRTTPAPVRGEVLKRLGRQLEEHKSELAELVTLEAGKIRSEALGEVQEMIDICDYAVGLSRSMSGRTIPSERPSHRLAETWHPRGVVAVISAFNFPVAVWSWNTAIALVCGDTVVWKPSEITPLSSLACAALLERAIAETSAPQGIHQLVLADRADAEALLDDPRIALVSATGSERMGREIAPRVAARFGASLLELGGNNASIVTPSADLDLAVRGITFAAAGTAGQRCTTLRRVIAHTSIIDELLERLVPVFAGLRVGDPRDEGTLVGPLINAAAYERMQQALSLAQSDGGTVLVGGERVHPGQDSEQSYYVRPAIVRMPAQSEVVRTETFAPILYVLSYNSFEEAIALQNGVPQGLSSSVFTMDQREAELFCSAAGSDCGIANVNIGTSGAEIGGAFGGEKSTGGGRESGSDAWKAYMRRATNTINYSTELPLAQGVTFA